MFNSGTLLMDDSIGSGMKLFPVTPSNIPGVITGIASGRETVAITPLKSGSETGSGRFAPEYTPVNIPGVTDGICAEIKPELIGKVMGAGAGTAIAIPIGPAIGIVAMIAAIFIGWGM